MNSKYLKLD